MEDEIRAYIQRTIGIRKHVSGFAEAPPPTQAGFSPQTLLRGFLENLGSAIDEEPIMDSQVISPHNQVIFIDETPIQSSFEQRRSRKNKRRPKGRGWKTT